MENNLREGITIQITESNIVKSEKITTNLANPYLIEATLRKCFFSLFSNFNDEKFKVQVLQ